MPRRVRLRTLMLAILFLAVTFPLGILTAFHAFQYSRLEKQKTVSRLQESAEAMAETIQIELHRYRDGITVLAGQLERAGRSDRASLESALVDIAPTYPEFLTMIVVDANGKIVAEKQKQGAPVSSSIGHSVADREYFQVPMKTGRSFVSDAFRGRHFGTDPIVAVSAPIKMPNGATFVVEGSLNLLDFARLEARYKGIPGERVLITDSKDQVLYASPFLKIAPLTDVSGSKLLALEKESSGKPYVITEAEGPTYMGHYTIQPSLWHVYFGQPVSYSRADLRSYHLAAVLVGVGGIIMSSLLATWMARSVNRPIHALAESSRNLIMNGKRPNISPSATTPMEIAALVDDLQLYSERLSKALTGLLPICSSCKSIRDENGNWIRIESYIKSKTEAEFTHGLCPTCADRLYPELRSGAWRPPDRT
ncbi:MAG: hypothetical protein AB1714_02675 [Acidobacteriota bacterium]